MEEVLQLLRGARELGALVYVARPSTDALAPWAGEHELVRRPLADSHLTEAWNALGEVTHWDVKTLGRVRFILMMTTADDDEPSDLPPLGEVEPPPPPRATAKHPRAYRGTKEQPPKPRRPDPIDVRPYLIARRHIKAVLELCDEHDEVDGPAARDPALVTIERALGVQDDPEMRAVLVGISIAAGERAVAWASHVLAHEPAQRLSIARIVCASGIAKCAPLDPSTSATLAALTIQQQWTCYRALAHGATPEYVIAGLFLDAIGTQSVVDIPCGTIDPTDLVLATVERLGEAMAEDSGADFWRSRLWWSCGSLPGLVDLLAMDAFRSITPSAAFWVMRAANSTSWGLDGSERWEKLQPALSLLTLMAAPIRAEYQRKFVEDLIDLYWWLSEDQSVLLSIMRALPLCRRLAAPPFSTEPVLGAQLDIVVDYGLQMIEAPDASWLALEDACRRANAGRLIARGLERLAGHVPRLIDETFATNPSALIETVEALSTISSEEVDDVLVAYRRSPLGDPLLHEAPIDVLCAAVEPVARAGGPNPIRRALQKHLSGESPLSDAQVAGHRVRIVEDLGIVRLAAIRQAIEIVLRDRIGATQLTPVQRHAVAMLAEVEMHRRQLRKLVTATLAGDRDWLVRHPRTAAWFAKHPKIDRDVWLGGIDHRAGDVALTIERDPLEALKLGTYVGSCLGRGGSFAYSAAAVVLDVNKRVVYARDSRGVVVGRQLVALSDDDRLVCFYVYGAKAKALEPIFAEFDRKLAAKLGVALRAPADEYTISAILSHRWWDDTAWDVESDRGG